MMVVAVGISGELEAPATLGKSTLSGRIASTTIAYPFQILAWEEDNGAPPPPKPRDDSDEPSAPSEPTAPRATKTLTK